MNANNLRSRREKLEMTQKAVAEAVGISQQHLQRLEAGTSPLRLPLAEKIAKTLSSSIDDLFPQLAKVVRRDHALLTAGDHEARQMIDEWEKAGIDIDAGYWQVYWHISGHGTEFARVSGATARRLIDESESNASGFMVFDSDTRRYAVALRDEIVMEFRRENELDEMALHPMVSLGDRRVKVYASGRNSYLEYYVDPDEAALFEHPKKRSDMQQLFAALRAGDRPRVRIVSRYEDQPAEEAGLYYVPVGSILSVEAPLAIVDPAFRKAIEDGGGSKED